MPLFMGIHLVGEISLEDTRKAHLKDLAVQEKYGVTYHQYWLNKQFHHSTGVTRMAVPGEGHLVHMPAYTYIRVGEYHEGTLANQRAIKTDDDYVAQGVYPLAYVSQVKAFISHKIENMKWLYILVINTNDNNSGNEWLFTAFYESRDNRIKRPAHLL